MKNRNIIYKFCDLVDTPEPLGPLDGLDQSVPELLIALVRRQIKSGRRKKMIKMVFESGKLHDCFCGIFNLTIDS